MRNFLNKEKVSWFLLLFNFKLRVCFLIKLRYFSFKTNRKILLQIMIVFILFNNNCSLLALIRIELRLY